MAKEYEDLLPVIEAEQDVIRPFDDYEIREWKRQMRERSEHKPEMRELSYRVAEAPRPIEGMSRSDKDELMANFALTLGDVLGTSEATALLEEGIKPIGKLRHFKDVKAIRPTKRVVERPEAINKWNTDQIMRNPYSREAVDNRYPARYYNAHNDGDTYAFYPEWSEQGIPTGRPNFEDIKSVGKTRSVSNKSGNPKMDYRRINRAWETQSENTDLPPADPEALATAWKLFGGNPYNDKVYVPKGYKPTHEKKYYSNGDK